LGLYLGCCYAATPIAKLSGKRSLKVRKRESSYDIAKNQNASVTLFSIIRSLIVKVHALFVLIVLMLVLISLLSSGQGNDQYLLPFVVCIPPDLHSNKTAKTPVI
jgi:hypothetical protein